MFGKTKFSLMFTGLVQTIGKVIAIDKDGGDWCIQIESGLDLKRTEIGASICCSGACLTVIKIEKKSFFTSVSSETLNKTLIKNWSVGSRVNLEPSLRVGDEIGGHLVSGHIDGTAKVVDIRNDGQSKRIDIEVPADLARFIATKGSVTLDGVSLTVNEVQGYIFGVNVIPHTLEATTLGSLNIGELLNIEVDMLARYVARMLAPQLKDIAA